MTLLKYYRDLEGFSKNLVISFFLHVLIILFFSVSPNFFSNEIIILPDSIRVDVIALPEKVKQEKPVPTPKKIKKIELKSKSKKNTKSVDLIKKQKEALNQLKALNALEKIKSDVADEKDKKKERERKEKNSQEKEKPKVFKGNIISSGASLSGLNRLSFDKYLSSVKEHIRKNFILPAYLKDQSFQSQVAVQVDNTGYIISKKLIQTSGNSLFDQSVLTAVDNSSPIPEPPERLKSILSKNSFILSFP